MNLRLIARLRRVVRWRPRRCPQTHLCASFSFAISFYINVLHILELWHSVCALLTTWPTGPHWRDVMKMETFVLRYLLIVGMAVSALVFFGMLVPPPAATPLAANQSATTSLTSPPTT